MPISPEEKRRQMAELKKARQLDVIGGGLNIKKAKPKPPEGWKEQEK